MENVQVIQNTLSKATSEATPSEIKKILSTLVKELSSYYDKLDNFYKRVEKSAKQKINLYNSVEANENTVSYAVYKELKQYNEEATLILKEGYIIIDKIREFFTGESIVYRIGIPYYSKVYELKLTISELLEYTQADYNTQAKEINNIYKLRMLSNKGNLLQKYSEYKQEITAVGESGSTLFSSIWHYINYNISNHGVKYNQGNVYEAYRVYKERQKTNLIPPAEFNAEEFDEILTSVRSNIAAATQGGDVGLEQIKFLSSAPSLITTAQIKRVLASLLSALRKYIQTSNNKDFETAMKNLFLKDGSNLVEDIDKAALEQATEYMENIIKNKLNLTK